MQWRADTTAGFSMLLAAAKTPPEPRLLTALGDRFAGMVGDGGLAQASWTGGADARAIRAAIESLAEPGVLLVDGKPPSIEALRTAQILAQLLGRG